MNQQKGFKISTVSQNHIQNHSSHHQGAIHGSYHVPAHGSLHVTGHATSHSSNHGPSHGSSNSDHSHRSSSIHRQNHGSVHVSHDQSSHDNKSKSSCQSCCLHAGQNAHKNNIDFPVKSEIYDYEDNGIDKLLQYNKMWSNDIQQKDPSYFTELAKHQSPEYLWIGCSDSRIPVERLVGLGPGQMFVHRNIANQVIYSDINCLSVIQYAVDVLKVKHIIVCGHYQCGGVKAAIDNPQIGVINNWISHIREIYLRHKKQLQELDNHDLMCDKLVELNLAQQVYNIGTTNILQNAWDRGQEITVHGWIYGLKDGKIREVGYAANSNHVLENAHEKLVNKILSSIEQQKKQNSHSRSPSKPKHQG